MSDSQTPTSFLAPDPAEIAPLFPGYEIECLIATGGMGAVYRAVQKSLDRTVAIKILPHEFSKDAAFCEGFEAEAKAMARLNHPNLIGVYDFGEVNGMLYIIMEYVPGKSLFHSAHGIAIDPNEAIRLVTGICNGLAHAHENGILHRDIKPSNILLDLNAQPKIGDFGLARPVERKIQEGEEIFGTPHYTAPEVVNSPQSVGYRADIFSVGVMLHELLTGRLPADDRRPASAIVHCDPRFDAIIRRASNPLPEARYASAAEITRDLGAIAQSTGPRVLRTTAAHAPARPGSIRPVTSTSSSSSAPAIVGIVIALAIAAAAFVFLSKPAGSSNDTTTDQTDITKTDPVDPPKPPAPPTPKPDPVKDPGNTSKPDPAEDTAGSDPPKPSTDPEPMPVVDNNPPPVPEPDDEAKPKFDVRGFFERARTIMQERATPGIATRNEDLIKNLDDFERAVKRQIRKLDFGRTRDKAEETLEEFMTVCREDENHLPEKLEKESDAIRGIGDVHKEHLEIQEKIETKMLDSLKQLSSLYVLGLEKQIERLKTEKDPAAITLIEEEIAKVRDSERYFPYLMLGIDPEEQEELEKKEAGDEKADED